MAGEAASHAKRSLEAVKRFPWVDYEDMSGISQELLRPISAEIRRCLQIGMARHAPMYVCGLSRWSNECRRTLVDSIGNVVVASIGPYLDAIRTRVE